LKAAYEKLGATPDKPIIVSCGQGQMSAHTYVTLKYLLGYKNVRNYDGSFQRMVKHPDLPIETGMKIEAGARVTGQGARSYCMPGTSCGSNADLLRVTGYKLQV